tara:strand:+ start:572 stop:811 length:240 start_codon:yes stop_codon:yes gene_type:complete
MIKNLIINLCIAVSMFTGAVTIEKWAPEHVREQIIEKKKKNKEDFQNRVEVMNAKKDKMRVDTKNRKEDRKRKRNESTN